MILEALNSFDTENSSRFRLWYELFSEMIIVSFRAVMPMYTNIEKLTVSVPVIYVHYSKKLCS